MSAPTSRLLNLLSLLQTRRDWPGPLLADRLGISHRTVRRDVDRLRELGYRITATMGPDGGYRLDAGADLPPLLFDDDQAVAIAVALRTAAVSGAGIEEAALRALTTLRQVLPARLRHRLDVIEPAGIAARPGDAPATPVSPGTLLEVATAVRAEQVLRFDYASQAGPAAPPSRRRVEPHGLIVSAGRWYLMAWDLDREDWRVYRVDRMTPSLPHGRRFAPRAIPGGSAAAFVSARFSGSAPDAREDRWPCTGTVVLDLPARDVLPFAGDGTAEDLGDGRTRLTSGSWSWVALAAALARFDAAIEVIGPPELRAAFATLAERSAAAAGRAR